MLVLSCVTLKKNNWQCCFADKELYAWMKCVKGQPHDHKHLMPTQIIPGSGKTTCKQAGCGFSQAFSVKKGQSCFLKLPIFHLKICKFCQVIAGRQVTLSSYQQGALIVKRERVR